MDVSIAQLRTPKSFRSSLGGHEPTGLCRRGAAPDRAGVFPLASAFWEDQLQRPQEENWATRWVFFLVVEPWTSSTSRDFVQAVM